MNGIFNCSSEMPRSVHARWDLQNSGCVTVLRSIRVLLINFIIINPIVMAIYFNTLHLFLVLT